MDLMGINPDFCLCTGVNGRLLSGLETRSGSACDCCAEMLLAVCCWDLVLASFLAYQMILGIFSSLNNSVVL